MNVVWMLLAFFYAALLWGKAIEQYPDFNLKYLMNPSLTVYYGEKLYIPFVLNFVHLANSFTWYSLPGGSHVEQVSGYCPPLGGFFNLWYGQCYYNLVIPGNTLNKVFSGAPTIAILWEYKERKENFFHSLPPVNVRVIPHPPSMLIIPDQQATANEPFALLLKPYIRYYDENLRAGVALRAEVTPVEQDGLKFDSQQMTITGIPARTGTYVFTIRANTPNYKTQATALRIEVGANLKDKPVFKSNFSLLSAIPNQTYRMNLLELIKSKPGFMISNQVHFRLKPDSDHMSWLTIPSTNPTLLEGMAPAASAGQVAEATIIASTNTGGDSEPLTLSIPVTYDPSRKPEIKPFTLSLAAGTMLDFNLASHVLTVDDEPWDLFIEHIEPLAPWLSHNKNALQGLIPLNATGHLYQITLRISTASGGSSESITVPLQVEVDKKKTPRFKNSSILLPFAVPNTAYRYDFEKNNAVYPSNIPYQIEFDPDHAHPGWITIENNQLIIENVPEINETRIPLHVVIKNIPGGNSLVYEIYLDIAHDEPIRDNDRM